MKALVALAAGLALPGVLPALAVGRSAIVVFLAPVIGALMAAVGAVIELGLGGSLVPDYLAVAVAVNVAVIAWWLAARHATGPAQELIAVPASAPGSAGPARPACCP